MTCECAKIEEGKIYCVKRDCLCGHVFYCPTAGKYKQTRQAEKCPVRKEGKNAG